ncbi:MAG: SAM-dependent methyltransferase [Paenibacillus sp.]|nr:SAM-dependent methyltransferase [Paenibacillus sp.]
MNRAATIREACLQASSSLRLQGVSDSDTSAEWLMQHVLGVTRSEMFMRWNEPLPEELRERWERMLLRRATGEPVQYITGEQEFYGLPFHVTSAVLIPRPETELLVEAIVEAGTQLWPGGRPLVADIGSGSGAISVTIAVRRPDWRVTATDISEAALAVARENAERNGVADCMQLYQGDLLEVYIREKLPVDILVSNPPYIESAAIPELQSEVRLFEPSLALDGGSDGLQFYRRILQQVDELPYPPALIGFEVGAGQAREVAAWMEQCGHWDSIRMVSDLSGIERHLVGRRKI